MPLMAGISLVIHKPLMMAHMQLCEIRVNVGVSLGSDTIYYSSLKENLLNMSIYRVRAVTTSNYICELQVEVLVLQ